MQDGVPQAPHWMQYGLGILAAILSGIGIDKLYNSWLNRHKPASEIHVTEATAAEIKVRAHSSAGDALSRMMDRLDAAQVTIDGVRSERDEARCDRDDWKMRAELLEIEARSLRDQVDGAYNYIKFLGKHPTDVDRFRVQLKEGKKDGPA